MLPLDRVVCCPIALRRVTVKLALPEQFPTFHFVTGGGQRIDLPPKKWTGLGGFFLLLDRGDLSDRGVKPGSVVKAFDEGEDIPHGLDAVFVLAMMDEFGLQGMKEALHGALSKQSALRLMEAVMPTPERSAR